MQLLKILIFPIKVKILSFLGKLRPPNSTGPALPTCQSGCRWEEAAPVVPTPPCSAHQPVHTEHPACSGLPVCDFRFRDPSGTPLRTCPKPENGRIIPCWPAMERPAGVANSSGWKEKAAHGPDWQLLTDLPSTQTTLFMVLIQNQESSPWWWWFSSLPSSSVHGILQARILEWIAISFSRGSSWSRNWTLVSCIAGRFSTDGARSEARHCP